MRAMLLAAGLGHRMLPLTLSFPKAAVPVLGRPLAARILRRLARHGVERAVVNLHQHPQMLRRVLESEVPEGLPRIDFTHEERILGTAGGLRNAGSLLRGDGPVLVHNADALADIDIGAVLATHRRSGVIATLVLTEPRPGYASVDVDTRGRVVALGGRPAVDRAEVAHSYLFTGCHIIEEEVLDRIPRDGPSHIVQDVYLRLAAEGGLGHYLHRGFWWEFGSPARYLDGCLRLLELAGERRAPIDAHDPVRRVEEALVATGPGAKLGRDVRLSGGCVLGADTHVGRGSSLADCVLFPGTRIGSGCRLTRTVVGPGSELADGFEAESVAIAADPETAGALAVSELEPGDR